MSSIFHLIPGKKYLFRLLVVAIFVLLLTIQISFNLNLSDITENKYLSYGSSKKTLDSQCCLSTNPWVCVIGNDLQSEMKLINIQLGHSNFAL